MVGLIGAVTRTIANRNIFTTQGRRQLGKDAFNLSGGLALSTNLVAGLPNRVAAQATYYNINIEPFIKAANRLGCAFDLYFRQEQNGEITSWFNTNSNRCYKAVAETPAYYGTQRYLPGGAGEQGINENKFNLNPRQIRFNMQKATGLNWYELEHEASLMLYNPHYSQIPAVLPVTEKQNINSPIGTQAQPVKPLKTILSCNSIAQTFNDVTTIGPFSRVRAICD